MPVGAVFLVTVARRNRAPDVPHTPDGAPDEPHTSEGAPDEPYTPEAPDAPRRHSLRVLHRS